jgi:hypothetical protein
MSYLRNGWSVNLQAIENCIFSIRSIERNMRPILRTVWFIGKNAGLGTHKPSSEEIED